MLNEGDFEAAARRAHAELGPASLANLDRMLQTLASRKNDDMAEADTTQVDLVKLADGARCFVLWTENPAWRWNVRWSRIVRCWSRRTSLPKCLQRPWRAQLTFAWVPEDGGDAADFGGHRPPLQEAELRPDGRVIGRLLAFAHLALDASRGAAFA